MRLAILSRSPSSYSTSRLVQAAKKRGHEVDVIDTLRCYMNITADEPSIYYKGQKLPKYDAIIPRIGASATFYGCSIVRQFELMGVFCINSSISITRSRDKLRALQLLARKGIHMPISSFAHSTNDVKGLIKLVGGAPLVIKLLEGTQGIGVVLAETNKAAESVIEAFYGLKANILVQEYIKEAGGADIRCFVIGNKVVAAMKRQAEAGEFRSNLHRGGTSELVAITKQERDVAINAAKIMGLRMAGVDLLRSKRGPLVMEVNSSPGLQGIENATEKDVASVVIAYLEKHAKPISMKGNYQG
ncbi:MAG: ribosomal protein modification protein [Gammaproteobacteria bacterium]|jgi:ribosomal protein S6--L-glutamate ligase|nr:ribosomal protein modification protein [Gammaproteobacteria bacterium]